VPVVELVEGAPYPGMCGDTVVFEPVHDDTEQVAVVSYVAELMHEGGNLGQPAGSHLQGSGTGHGLEHPGLQPGPHTLGRQAENPGRGGHRNTGDFGETPLTDLGEAVAYRGAYRLIGQRGVEVFDVGHGVLGHGGAEGGSHQLILTPLGCRFLALLTRRCHFDDQGIPKPCTSGNVDRSRVWAIERMKHMLPQRNACVDNLPSVVMTTHRSRTRSVDSVELLEWSVKGAVAGEPRQ